MKWILISSDNIFNQTQYVKRQFIFCVFFELDFSPYEYPKKIFYCVDILTVCCVKILCFNALKLVEKFGNDQTKSGMKIQNILKLVLINFNN